MRVDVVGPLSREVILDDTHLMFEVRHDFSAHTPLHIGTLISSEMHEAVGSICSSSGVPTRL